MFFNLSLSISSSGSLRDLRNHLQLSSVSTGFKSGCASLYLFIYSSSSISNRYNKLMKSNPFPSGSCQKKFCFSTCMYLRVACNKSSAHNSTLHMPSDKPKNLPLKPHSVCQNGSVDTSLSILTRMGGGY